MDNKALDIIDARCNHEDVSTLFRLTSSLFVIANSVIVMSLRVAQFCAVHLLIVCVRCSATGCRRSCLFWWRLWQPHKAVSKILSLLCCIYRNPYTQMIHTGWQDQHFVRGEGNGKIVSERAVKLCRVSGGLSPLILNLGTKWQPVVRAAGNPLGTRWGGGVPGAGPNFLEKKNILRVCLWNNKSPAHSAVSVKVRQMSFYLRCIFSLIPLQSPLQARSQPALHLPTADLWNAKFFGPGLSALHIRS